MKNSGLIAIFTIAIVIPSVAQAQFDFKKAKIPFSDEAVQKAIDKGSEFLLSRQQADGSWPEITAWGKPIEDKDDAHNCKIAATSMALYALMEKGMSYQDEKIAKGLNWLADNQEVPAGRDSTYCVAFRVQAWLRAWKQAKEKDKNLTSKYRKSLETDVAKYVSKEKDKNFDGGYFYYLSQTGGANDPSNSQYALLAAWAGYRGGMEIPKEYWEKVLKYWISRQRPEGGWGYESGADPTYTMTAAGIASLFVCIDALMGERFIKCNVTTEFAPVKKGLDWYDEHFKEVIAKINPGGGQNGEFFYGLYGIERIGLASGYKYFGDADWYKLGSIRILNVQAEDGSWNSNWGPDVASSYALLFLIRGQHGIIFNRLEYDGDWNNRPRALANFCRWAEGVYEQEVNWQIITLKSDTSEWHDAPVLTISGSRPPKFSDDDIVKLRTYVNQGGMIFSINECNGSFGLAMKNAYKKIFPRYELAVAGKSSPLYSCQYKLPGAPAFFVVSNGIRPLAIHTDADLPVSWQTYSVATGKPNFEAAANVLMVATDKTLKNRGSNLWPAEPEKAPSKSLKAARIRYSGNYDPEPLALQRLSRQMAKLHDLKLDLVETAASAPASAPASAGIPETGMEISELTDKIKIAFMTGTGGFLLNQQDKQALKKWVDGGGLLVMDAAGAAKGFADAAKDMIGELWGADSLLPLPMDSPIYQLKDMTIKKVKYRRATRTRIGGMTEPRLMAVLDGSRPKVLLSTEDITGGLVGYSGLGLDGYEPESAYDMMRNMCIYMQTASGK